MGKAFGANGYAPSVLGAETCIPNPELQARTLHSFPHRPLSSSFLGLPYRILNITHKKELLRGLWVYFYLEYPLFRAHTGSVNGFFSLKP